MDNSDIKSFGALAHLAGAGWASIVGVVFSIILIASAGKNRSAKLLGWQGLLWVVVVAAIGIVFSFLFFIPVAGWLLWWLIQIAALVISILWAVKIYNGKKVEIPFISDWARKIVK